MGSPNDVIVHELKERDEEVLAYWTPERRGAAIPMPVDRALRPRKALPREPGAEPGIVLPEGWPAPEAPEVGPITELVGNIQAAPYRSCGKVYFRWKGKDYSGSAWKLANQAICTAGHNVHDKGEWATSLVFYLRYRDGASDGIYTVGTLLALRGWVENGDLDYDLGACRTKVAIDPQNTAALGFAYNQPLADLYTAVGYPGEAIPNYPFDGKYMWRSSGSPAFPEPNPVIAHINLTKGASGSPWFATIQDKWVVNGTHAHGTAEMSDSPYFGQGIRNIYDTASQV